MNGLPPIACAALLLALAPAAWPAANKSTSDARQHYQQERALCLSGKSQQDRRTCLREAAAAYQEARSGRLGNGAAASFSRNATQRCDAQPAAEREACVQRILGAGSAEGSVAGGGILRRAETPSR